MEIKGLDEPVKRARPEKHKCIEDIKIIVNTEHFYVCECAIKLNKDSWTVWKPSPILLHALSLSKEIEFPHTTLKAVKIILDKEYFGTPSLSEKIDIYLLAHEYECERTLTDVTRYSEYGKIEGKDVDRMQGACEKLISIIRDRLDDIKDWENISGGVCRKLIVHCKTFPTFVKCFLRCGEFNDDDLMILAKQHSVKKKRIRTTSYFPSHSVDHKDEIVGIPIDEKDYKIIPYDNKYFSKYLAYRLKTQIDAIPQEYVW